jgi:glycosyltransferase involved in cell wall biosynthesis
MDVSAPIADGPSGRPMHLLHAAPVYAPAWSFGGTVRSVTALAEATAALGVRVTVVTTVIGTEDSSSAKPIWRRLNGVDVCYCPARMTPAGIWAPAATKVLVEQSRLADVGHITSCWVPFGIGAYRAFRDAGLPYVSSPRGGINSYSFSRRSWKKFPYFLLFERRIQESAAAIHATSPMEAEELLSLLAPGSMEMVPNMCSSKRWFYDPIAGAAWRDSVGMRADSQLLLYCGRVEHTKNLAFMAPVMQMISRKRECRFVILGPSARGELDKVLAAFRRLGIKPPLVMPGTGDDRAIRAAYSGCDVFVLPSLHENFSNVVTEAAMCGATVIASPHVGVARMIEAQGAAQVVQLDPKLWASAVMGSAHRRRARVASIAAMFSPETVARSMLGIYDRVRRPPGRAGAPGEM